VALLCQGRTAAAQCVLFTYKSVPVIFEPSCIKILVLTGSRPFNAIDFVFCTDIFKPYYVIIWSNLCAAFCRLSSVSAIMTWSSANNSVDSCYLWRHKSCEELCSEVGRRMKMLQQRIQRQSVTLSNLIFLSGFCLTTIPQKKNYM